MGFIFACFGIVGKTENAELSDQELRFSFLCNFFTLDPRGSKG